VFIVSAMVMFRQIQTFKAEVILPALALLAVSVVAVVLLVRRERRTPHALFPIVVFRNPSIWRSDVLALCHGAALVSLITFLPIYLRVGLGADAGTIGLFLLPVTVSVPVGSILTGVLISFTGRTAIFPSFGLIVVVASLASVAYWLRSFDGMHLSLMLGLVGMFMGTVMSVVQLTVQQAAGREMLGTAAASVQFSRTIGAALGTALVSTVVFATMSALDPSATDVVASILQQGPEILKTLAPARAAVIETEIVDAFRAAFLTIGIFAAVAMVLAWTLPMRRL
jgi:predicted MFS family arabinose efflux permease